MDNKKPILGNKYWLGGCWWIIKINGKSYAHKGGQDGVITGAIRRHGIQSDELDILATRLSQKEKEKYKSFAAFRRAIEAKN